MNRPALAFALSSLVAALFSAFCAPDVAAQAKRPDWPAFRGPRHDSIAPLQARPPATWSDTENIAWRAPLPGPGASTPLVLGSRVIVTSYTGYGADPSEPGEPDDLRHQILAFDRDDGSPLWRVDLRGHLPKPARQVQIQEHGFASPTPAVSPDQQTLYVYFGKVGLLACDTASGAIHWHADLGSFETMSEKLERPADREGLPPLRWGAAASPLVWRDLVLVNASEESDSFRAFDRETGEPAWSIVDPALEGSAVTPAVYPGLAPDGGDLLVVVVGGAVWGLDPATGERHWTVETGTKGGMSPMPLVAGRRLFAFGGGAECFAIDLDDSGQPTVAWKSLNSDIPSPLLHDGRIFIVDMQGTGSILDADTGDALFRGRWPGRTGGVYANPTFAAGRLYVTSRERGVFVYRHEAASDGTFGEPELIAQNRIASDESRFQGSPAIVDDRIYLRSESALYCIAEPGGEDRGGRTGR
jgi:outer membrane protein assembly factor BamB